ncbi:ABC transporter substrate-binding protein [Leekyejoonella antrihumi]|nr:ABC transporter substrate-binding protein [Leekyejoonella antrihumi]
MTLAACTTSGAGSTGSSAAGSGQASGGSAGTSSAAFNIAIGVDPDTLDPAQQTTSTIQNILDYDLQGLVTFDQSGKLEPLLATSWKTSADAKSITFKLRTGVKFQDGTPFNAKAVQYSLDRLISGKVKVPIGGAYQVMKRIVPIDAHTVRIDLKNADPDLLPNLAATMAEIISPTSATKNGNKPTNIVDPVGTGPYKFVQFQNGQSVTLTRYAGYWGSKPYYKEVVFNIVPEANSREAGLRSGQYDLIMNPPLSDLTALAAGGNITVSKFPDDRSVFFAFNVTQAPFNNQKVRQAFNYAVDKKALIKNVLFNAVDQMDSPFANSITSHCTAGSYAYNPTKAKQLLKEAGVGKISLTIGTSSGRYLQDQQTAEAIAGYLRQVGVTAKVQTSDWPTYLNAIEGPNSKNGPYPLHILGWAPSALDAPVQMQMLLKADWPTNGGLNTSFYSDPKVESLFAKANMNLDETSRNAQYCQIQKQVWADAPWIFLWSQTLTLAYKSNLAGISYQPNEKFVTVGAHPK